MDKKLEKKLAKQKAKEELMLKIRKEDLAREKTLNEQTLSKIKDRWFDSVVDLKVPEMQDNLRHILHYMEKLIDAESFRKVLFEDERRELEEQSTAIAQSQISALEKLYDIYQKRVQDLEKAYNDRATQRKDEAQLEFKTLEDREKITCENMNSMLFQKQLNKERDEEMMNCDMFLKLDDERSKNTEKQENLRSKLEKKMETRWGEITSTLSKYEENTKLRMKDYIQLKTKDDADSRVIYQQMKKTQKLFDQLEELKKNTEHSYAPKETMIMIADRREEREKFFKTFKELKRNLANELQNDETALKCLTMHSNSLLSDLNNLCKTGEQILTLYRMCLKLETQFEKVIPVGGNFTLPKHTEGIKGKKFKQDNEEIIITYHGPKPTAWAENVQFLDKFWKKVGAVHISKMALKKCIDTMKKENAYLKKLLASYLREASQKKKFIR